jgi:hypothetical protein
MIVGGHGSTSNRAAIYYFTIMWPQHSPRKHMRERGKLRFRATSLIHRNPSFPERATVARREGKWIRIGRLCEARAALGISSRV